MSDGSWCTVKTANVAFGICLARVLGRMLVCIMFFLFAKRNKCFFLLKHLCYNHKHLWKKGTNLLKQILYLHRPLEGNFIARCVDKHYFLISYARRIMIVNEVLNRALRTLSVIFQFLVVLGDLWSEIACGHGSPYKSVRQTKTTLYTLLPVFHAMR